MNKALLDGLSVDDIVKTIDDLWGNMNFPLDQLQEETIAVCKLLHERVYHSDGKTS